MEETLTDCLVRVREDLNNLERVRKYLDTNKETVHCTVTWRTIEAFNSILGVCSSQHTPQTNALDTLLDSFYHLARNNADPNVWSDFGFELGIICVKVLSAIERSESFEVLFCKLLTVINMICEHNTNVWKAAARQILNVFINKKFSLSYFERVIKLYLSILRNIESFTLLNFSSQNLHLLKALSKLVQKVGDFEIQSDIVELVFLHLLNNKQSMSDFFAAEEKKLFESLQFTDFEADCRTYLNAVNKPRGGLERKVYSVYCHVLYLGGCFVEPPVGTNSLWVDANKETERLSIRCADVESESNRVIYIQFSDILRVQLANEKTKGNRCLTLQTKSLSGLQFDVKNEDICLMIENGKALYEFLNFLNEETRSTGKTGRKMSKTRDSLVIDRSSTDRIEKVQDNAVTSSEKRGVDYILPDILNLFERVNHPTTTSTQTQIKTTGIVNSQTKTPPSSQNALLGSQELSPNSFVESLNQHIGRDSPEIPHTFEDSVETIEFLQRNISGGSHKLFRSPDRVFDIKPEEPQSFNLIFDEEKENKPIVGVARSSLKTYERKREKAKPSINTQEARVLRVRKNLEPKLGNTQSQDYFQHSGYVLRKRKPSLPKLKRSSKTKNQKPEVRKSKVKDKDEEKIPDCRSALVRNTEKNERKGQWENVAGTKGDLKELKAIYQEKQRKSEGQKMTSERGGEEQIPRAEAGNRIKGRSDVRREKKLSKEQEFQPESKSSLLDPNGYAFRRWCKPTTSERSNFWLKKLTSMQKSKAESENVFNFSEDSDTVSAKNRGRKRRVVHSKRKYRTNEMEQMSLKHAKKILKKASPKQKQIISPRRNIDPGTHCSTVIPKSPESFGGERCQAQPVQFNNGLKHSSSLQKSPQNNAKESNGDSDFSNEDENPPTRIKKRERSIEENSLVKTHIKKKSKISLPCGKFPWALQRRLLKRQKEDKHQTDDIIQTVKRSICITFNYLQRKEGQKLLSYLNVAEEAVGAVESEAWNLSLRAKRIQRAMMYFQIGCSVSDLCESLENHFSGVRSVLRALEGKKDDSKAIGRVNQRLANLIKSEIERSIDGELTSRRNRLLKYASIFNTGCGRIL